MFKTIHEPTYQVILIQVMIYIIIAYKMPITAPKTVPQMPNYRRMSC